MHNAMQLRLDGFSFFCKVHIDPEPALMSHRHSRAMRTEVMQQAQQQPQGAAGAGGLGNSVMKSRTVTGSTGAGTASAGSKEAAGRSGRAVVRRRVQEQQPFVARASGTPGVTEVVVLLSPFHYISPGSVASLLLHHMAWHSRLGGCRGG